MIVRALTLKLCLLMYLFFRLLWMIPCWMGMCPIDVADPEVMPDPVVSWEEGESGLEGVLMELKLDQDIGRGKINIVDVLKPDG